MQEWLTYVLGRLKADRPVTCDVGGQPYAVKADGTIGEAIRGLAPQWTKPHMQVGSLTALVELYSAGLDDFDESETALHVADHRLVRLVSIKADAFGQRHVYATATYNEETPFKFNNFLSPEKFMIDFRASFLWNEEAVKVATVLSSLESAHSVVAADDGLSQRLEIKSGTTTKTPVILPAEGVPLIPWRTFREAAPVESRFLLRLQGGTKDAPPNAALFEIDQKWKLDTVQSVAAWLKEHLPAEARILA